MCCAAASGLFAFASFAAGQDGGAPAEAQAVPPADEAEKRVHASFSMNLWAVGLDGDAVVQGNPVSIGASFLDLVDESDSIFGFDGRVEVGMGRVSGYFDGTYMEVGVEDQPTPAGAIDLTSQTTILEAGVQFRVGEWSMSGEGSPDRNVALDLYAGARYTDLTLTLVDESDALFRRGRNWVDPLVGARAGFDLSERWRFVVNGDVGGFGAGCDFTWAASGLFDYRFELFGADASATFGYRALGQDYSRGSGAEEFTWDMIMHGPVIGLTVRF